MNVYTQWKKYLETNQPTAIDMAAYAIARSLNSDDPLAKALHLLYAGFTPIKNKLRLLSGEYPYSALERVVGHDKSYKWHLEWVHKRLKSSLLSIFGIEDSEQLSSLLMDISKNIDVNYSKPYSYVVVRSDLDPAQKVVQSCHAIQEVTMEHPEIHKNTHMIVLQVPSQADLMKIEQHLKRYKTIKFHTFHEPDNNIGFTALATAPITNRYLRNFFAGYQLLD